jgi:hypothetical protein
MKTFLLWIETFHSISFPKKQRGSIRKTLRIIILKDSLLKWLLFKIIIQGQLYGVKASTMTPLSIHISKRIIGQIHLLNIVLWITMMLATILQWTRMSPNQWTFTNLMDRAMIKQIMLVTYLITPIQFITQVRTRNLFTARSLHLTWVLSKSQAKARKAKYKSKNTKKKRKQRRESSKTPKWQMTKSNDHIWNY